MCCATAAPGGPCPMTFLRGSRSGATAAEGGGTARGNASMMRCAHGSAGGPGGKPPSAAIVDSQSVQTTEKGDPRLRCRPTVERAHTAHAREHHGAAAGGDGASPADIQDRAGARPVWPQVGHRGPRLPHLWADAGYRGPAWAAWVQDTVGWTVEIVSRPPGTWGFAVLPRRGVGERTCGGGVAGDSARTPRHGPPPRKPGSGGPCGTSCCAA